MCLVGGGYAADLGAIAQLGRVLSEAPAFARGGIVRGSRGGTLARIGEGGQDEAVVPLGNGNTMVSNGGRGIGGAVYVEESLESFIHKMEYLFGSDYIQEILDELRRPSVQPTRVTVDGTGLGGLTLARLTQTAYDALATKDSDTLYVITA